MLADKNKELLNVLESNYVAMLDVASDIALVSLAGDAARVELGKYIHEQQGEIHDAARKLDDGN